MSILQDYTPEMVCSEIALCVNNEIRTNDISTLSFERVDTEPVQVAAILPHLGVV